MKKLFLIVSFILASIGLSLGENPLYSFENNLSNYNTGWPFAKKSRTIDLKVQSTIFTTSITPVIGVATNSFIALANNNIVNALGYTSGTITPVIGVATNSYIALFNNNVVNAITSFTAAPTFSNATISGSLSVAGISQLSNSTTIGTGTVATNTSSLGILRVKQGSSKIDLGELSNGNSAMWFSSVTPTSTNYNIVCSYSNNAMTYNSGASGLHQFYLNDATELLTMTANYLKTPKSLRVGSTTVPTATLDVTGTMSVSSTATVNGNFKTNGEVDVATAYKINGTSAVETSSSRVLLSGGTYTAVQVSGSEPLILNNTAYTGGTTAGTIAVLSDAVFPVTFQSTSSNPADATTYYFGISGYQLTATATNSITLPYNCTLVGWDLNAVVSGASGTAETATLSINGTTNYTLSSSITYSTAYTNVNTTSISQNFNAGDKINIKLVCPNWATNPTAIFQGLTLWFVRRQ